MTPIYATCVLGFQTHRCLEFTSLCFLYLQIFKQALKMSVNELKLGQNERYLRLQRRVDQLEKSYKVNPLVNPYVPTLSKLPCPPPAWSKFFLLKQAIEQAHQDASGDVRVFAVEPKEDVASSGRREFIIASYEEFWFYYSQMKHNNRHFYEVIQGLSLIHI